MISNPCSNHYLQRDKRRKERREAEGQLGDPAYEEFCKKVKQGNQL
jgi:hypothetical protein